MAHAPSPLQIPNDPGLRRNPVHKPGVEPCKAWSSIDFAHEPSVAYVAIARSGSTTLDALLSKLYQPPDDAEMRRRAPNRPTIVAHDHECGLSDLLTRFHPRRVLVPLRPIHERIESGIRRAIRLNCSAHTGWPDACKPPKERAADRYVAFLQQNKPRRVVPPSFARPAIDYVLERVDTRNVSLWPVCTHQLRADVSHAFRAWGLNDSTLWDGVRDFNVHASDPPSKLSPESLSYLKSRYANDYAFVARHGCA